MWAVFWCSHFTPNAEIHLDCVLICTLYTKSWPTCGLCSKERSAQAIDVHPSLAYLSSLGTEIACEMTLFPVCLEVQRLYQLTECHNTWGRNFTSEPNQNVRILYFAVSNNIMADISFTDITWFFLVLLSVSRVLIWPLPIEISYLKNFVPSQAAVQLHILVPSFTSHHPPLPRDIMNFKISLHLLNFIFFLFQVISNFLSRENKFFVSNIIYFAAHFPALWTLPPPGVAAPLATP